jgi:hypothetical protein
MITKEPGFSDRWQHPIAARLGFQQRGASTSFEIVRGYEITVFSGPQPQSGVEALPSQLRITRWFDPRNPVSDVLVFYELLWAPLRDIVKNRFLACFESRSVDQKACTPITKAVPNADTRGTINGGIKDGLMIGGFADATIVLSPLGDVLRDDVSLAVCAIASDVLAYEHIAQPAQQGNRCDLSRLVTTEATASIAGNALQRTEFFGITHSLGSFLVLDAEAKANENRATGGEELKREALAFALFDDATVFMFANQVALLQLGRLDAVCTVKSTDSANCPARALPSLDALMNRHPGAPGEMTKYVAFNDANDLLGYELPPYLPDVGLTGTLVNVTVRNPGFRIPWLFKNPGGAHTRQGENRAIIKAVVEGFDVTWPPDVGRPQGTR